MSENGDRDEVVEWKNVSELKEGPIRHASLPQELLDELKVVYDEVGHYFDDTLEQFEIGFMRDLYPQKEVAIWGNIARAWRRYHDECMHGKVLDVAEERRIVGALIAISMGVVDVKRLGVYSSVARRLIQCYGSVTK